MNQPRHPLTDEVIEQYTRLAEAEMADRPRLLSELPAGPLRETVMVLLEAGESPEADVLEQPFLEIEQVLDPALQVPAEAPPQLGPRYVIEGPLGHGGYGDVYLARQQSPVQRPVAIKVLRPGQMDAASVERIGREARALAALDHPGIATVFEAGHASDGRPYLVTEYVDGPPIDIYCARHNLTFRQRCRLVAALCDAVEHAHQRGVIHRDLKPTNVLVAQADQPEGELLVKIVDLGIARILDPSGAGETLTQAGALLGTVGYMAPEQLRGEPADTRSDLFALGRLLQSLLAEAPAPPRFARDCAAIIRRATAAAPRDRYQSAGAFAADLRAMLADAPVAARRHSLLETSMRLVRRYPLPATLLLTLIITLTIGSTLIARQSAAAAHARDAQKRLLKDLLDGSVVNLSQYVGTAEERAGLAARLEAQLASMLLVSPQDPEVRALLARLWTEQARIALASDDPQSAEPLARRAAGEMMRLVDPVTADVEQVRELAYAIIIWGDMLAATGRPDEARQRYRDALALHEIGRARFPTHIGLLDDLAWSYDRRIERGIDDQDRIARARERLALASELLKLDSERSLSRFGLAVAHLRLGQLLFVADDPAGLDDLLYARSLLRPLVDEAPLRWAFVDNLARICTLIGRYHSRAGALEKARDAHAESVSLLLRTAMFGSGSAGDIARPLCSALARLAGVCKEAGRDDEAAAAWRLYQLITDHPGDWRMRIDWHWADVNPAPPPVAPAAPTPAPTAAPITPRSAPAP